MAKTAVKVIKGTLGYWDGLKVVPKTNKDKPFLLETDRAKELVRQGIVELVDIGNETSNLPEEEPDEEVNKADEENVSQFNAVDAVQ